MQNKRGFALVIALIVALMLSLLCLSLTLSSMKELQISTEFETHEKALLVADAGYSTMKQILRGRNIDTLLAQVTNVSFPTTDPSNTVTEWASRNPIPPFQARNIDFSSSSSSGTGVLRGIITGSTGQTVGDCSNGKPCGRFFARLTDNDDGDDNLTTDSDGTVFLRVVGVHPGLPDRSGSRRNSVAIIEAQLHREMTFDMTAPFSLISKQVTANFDGNSFLVDGYDHTGMAIDQLNGHNDAALGLEPFSAISCLYDNPGLGDATAAVNNVLTALTDSQERNVVGAGTPAVNDDTIEVRTSSNPDAANVFNAAYLQAIAIRLAAIADYTYPTGSDTTTRFSGGEVFGTTDDPKITYVKGDLDIAGTCSGAGILVVTGNLGGNGGFEFEGLVLVLGSGSVAFGGANKTIMGGIVVAKLAPGSPPTLGTANIDIRGRSEFYFAGDKIRMAASLMTMRALSWREITPEVEPAVQTAAEVPVQ